MSGTALFAAGQTTSAPFTLTPTGATGSQRISGLSFPASWVAGTVSFLVSNDNGQTYQQLYSPSGSLYTVTAASNSYIPVDRSIMATVTSLMIVSSVTQTSSVSVIANVTDVSLPNIGTVAASGGTSSPTTTIAPLYVSDQVIVVRGGTQYLATVASVLSATSPSSGGTLNFSQSANSNLIAGVA